VTKKVTTKTEEFGAIEWDLELENGGGGFFRTGHLGAKEVGQLSTIGKIFRALGGGEGQNPLQFW